MADEKLRERIVKEMREGTPRYERARNFSHQILHLMRDFIPSDRETLRRIEEYLLETAFEANAAIINVPPELDALNKIQLEQAMLEKAMQPLTVTWPPANTSE